MLREVDSDVKNCLAPPKTTENCEKLISPPEFFRICFFDNLFEQIIFSKLSETHVAEVWARSDGSSRGKRTFQVRRCRGRSLYATLYAYCLERELNMTGAGGRVFFFRGGTVDKIHKFIARRRRASPVNAVSTNIQVRQIRFSSVYFFSATDRKKVILNCRSRQ